MKAGLVRSRESVDRPALSRYAMPGECTPDRGVRPRGRDSRRVTMDEALRETTKKTALHPPWRPPGKRPRAPPAIARRTTAAVSRSRLRVDRTPVTQADREAEQAITAILQRAFLITASSERFRRTGAHRPALIIDPIDGSNEELRPRDPVWASS